MRALSNIFMLVAHFFTSTSAYEANSLLKSFFVLRYCFVAHWRFLILFVPSLHPPFIHDA
ncbi:hypothetical protein JS44_07290 [Anoxybacillus flavithermus]|uniref:Uncharacterized protein n=1 Tax=Anoxybacillus flavithermus TaxID=33934 RepID=A0A094J308_9BACL|nr:hypothetical protein JS44_07290 [Anoxybacillus flavithermus]